MDSAGSKGDGKKYSGHSLGKRLTLNEYGDERGKRKAEPPTIFPPPRWREKMKTLEELRQTEFPPRIWLFKNLLVESTINLLYGPPDVGKSWFALRLIESWLTGEKFLWWRPSPHNGKAVIYYSLEDDERQFKEDRSVHLSNDIDRYFNLEIELRIESPGD